MQKACDRPVTQICLVKIKPTTVIRMLWIDLDDVIHVAVMAEVCRMQ